MATLAAAFGGDIGANVTEITEAPVAAASLAEVYRAKSAAGGVAVAVKIQRPGLERKISLDLFVVRRLFILAHEHWQIAGFPTAMAIIDEVGASLFGELDFVREGRQQEHFRTVYGSQLHRLGVHVPRVLHELTSTRVLVTEWVEGVRPRELSARRRQALARTAVECLAMQLMGEGFVHCDPHEGNWLGLADGRVALLDFGLMAQMQMNHQEAMAHFAIHLVGSNYGALEEVLRQMGVLDESHADLRRPGVEEPFGVALTRALTGRGSVDGGGDGGGGASGARGVRRTFSELYEELSGLAFRYYFALPACEWPTTRTGGGTGCGRLALTTPPPSGMLSKMVLLVARGVRVYLLVRRLLAGDARIRHTGGHRTLCRCRRHLQHVRGHGALRDAQAPLPAYRGRPGAAACRAPQPGWPERPPSWVGLGAARADPQGGGSRECRSLSAHEAVGGSRQDERRGLSAVGVMTL